MLEGTQHTHFICITKHQQRRSEDERSQQRSSRKAGAHEQKDHPQTDVSSPLNKHLLAHCRSYLTRPVLLQRLSIRIINARLRYPYSAFYKPAIIAKQAFIFDELFYKTSDCLEEYLNMTTLERRMIQVARKMKERQSNKYFVFFYLG